MFPKKYRLRLTKEIEKVAKKGKKFKGERFDIFYLLDVSDFKATVLVSKKVCRKAVKRNRIKRVLRAALKDELLDYSGFKVWLLVKAKSCEIDYWKAREDFKKFLTKINNETN